MKKKYFTILLFFILFFVISLVTERKIKYENNNLNTTSEESEETSQYSNVDDYHIQDRINLVNIDGDKSNYYFEYKGEKFIAIYTDDNWKIINSYKITNRDDMKKICQALLDEHEIHGRDMSSYRTSEDMVYEWIQHNLAYRILSDDNKFKERAKDVDFDPEDQNRNIIEMYNIKIREKNFS